MLSKALCVALSAPVTFVLQGCGGDGTTTNAPGPSPSPSTAPGPTPAPATIPTTTVTTTTFTPRTAGLTPEEAVQMLNEMYMGFDESNDTSPLGVTMSFAGNPNSFHENLFCEGYAPGLSAADTTTHCFHGNTDCGMSGAVLNHKMQILQQNNGSKVAALMDRGVGYVFNQTLTEHYFGKCAYIYDGAASLNVNSRCGATAHGTADCNDTKAAFYNQCTSDGGTSYHTCTRDDPEIAGKMCKCESCSPQYGTLDPPHQKNDPSAAPCIYEMPALIVPADGPKSFTPSGTNHLRDALKQRLQGDRQPDQWNEVVLDEKLLIPQFHYDPTHTILAFVYVVGSSMDAQTAQSHANNMRDDFQSMYRVSGVPDIPVIELNAQIDFTQVGGPFRLAAEHRVVV